jgi:3-hydroxybutyryl-CoA dehydrogenase
MGAGIAQVFATSGFRVKLYDVNAAAVDAALSSIHTRLEKAVATGHSSREDAEATEARLEGVTDIQYLKDSTFIVEAIVESLDAKCRLFAELESVCGPDSILATNTSTLSVTEIASGLSDSGRAIGMHFFNPAHRNKLVEVIPGYETRTDVFDRTMELSRAVGLSPVRVTESPGGIVSRLQLIVRNEAARMVAEGVASAEDIDMAMKLGSGWPAGPLEVTDLVGLDVHVINSDSICNELGTNRFRPHPLLRKMVRAGHLGRKSGQGFFTYSEGGK